MGDALGPEGANFCLFYYAVSSPYYMMEPAHSHVNDMWLINLGGNALNVEEFDAEITMWWGEEGEKIVMDCTSVAQIPPAYSIEASSSIRSENPMYTSTPTRLLLTARP